MPVSNDESGDLPYRCGVGAALFNNKGLVWVGRRIDRRNQELEEYWQMPQGGIDSGEEPVAAVLREIEEETGTDNVEVIGEVQEWLKYELPQNLMDKVWEGRYRGQSQKWFALKFNGSDSDFNLTKYGRPEFDAWRWVELNTLPNLIVPFKKKIYERVTHEFLGLTIKLGEPQ